MKIHILVLLAMMPVLFWANAISLVQQNPDIVTLSFVLPEFSLEETFFKGTKYHKLSMDDGFTYGDEGYPQLRMFAVPVGIPVDGAASVSVLSTKTETIKNVLINPASEITLDGEDLDLEYNPDVRVYSQNQPYPARIAEVGKPAFIGDRQFVSVMVYPFQFNPKQRDLTVYKEIQFQVSLSGTKAASKDWQLSENFVDKAADSFFINNASSQSWRLPKKIDLSYQSPKNSLDLISEIQFVVDSEGIYKITYNTLKTFIDTELANLGKQMSWNIDSVDPRFLELKDEYGQIPIHFEGENDGSFDPGDYFEFFGDRHYGETTYYDDYTGENVYTLSLKTGYGARLVVENGGLTVYNPSGYILPDAYEETVHFEQQLVSDKLGRGWTAFSPNFYREDVWFWKKINAPNLEIVPVELEYPVESTIRSASTKVVLHGLTYSETLGVGQYDHEASIRLNSAMVNTHTWIGQTEKVFNNANPIANSFLRHGTNNFYISLSGNTVMENREQVLLDYIEIKYWRQYKTSSDYIKFSKPSNRPNGLYQFEIGGFSSPDVSVYKVGSSIYNNLQIEPFNVDGMAPWTVTMQDSVFSDAVRYYAVTESAKKIPKLMRMNIPSDLKSPMNSANVIVITPYEFTEAEGTLQLKSIWENDGHTVRVVSVQDVYDEFNAGIVSAESIKAFLGYAYNNWSAPQLSHVILLGEGIDDTRDNSPSRRYNLIPVKKTWTYKHGATASDTWYGCIVGNDLVPDVSISRIGIWTNDQILNFAQKAYNYRNNLLTNRLWNSHLTLTAGGKISDGNDIFSQQSERIRRKVIPRDYRVTRVFTTTQTVSSDYSGGTFHLKDAMNTGTQYVQFMGHGGGRIWADYNLFNFDDVATLNNQAYPVVLSLACYASAFDTNGSASISEAFIMQPNKGAIATLGFSGLGYLDHDETWGLAFGEAAFTHDFPTLGEAYVYGLARFYTTTSSTAARYALTNASVLMGDPLVYMNKPIPNVAVAPLNPNPVPGETVQVRAEFPPEVTNARLYVMKENEKTINVPFDLPVIGGMFNATYNVPTGSSNYSRRVMVAGYSPQKEYIGRSYFGVGRPVVFHHTLSPSIPAYSDSVNFTAKIFSTLDVMSMVCKVRTDTVSTTTAQYGIWVTLPMQQDPNDPTLWTTSEKLRKYNTGKELWFKYAFTDSENRTYESFLNSYVVAGPDLFLTDIRFEASPPRLLVKGKNIGNADAGATELRLYVTPSGGTTSLFSTQPYPPLAVEDERWDTIDLSGVPNANMSFEVQVNSSNTIPEWHIFFNTNNSISIDVPFNYFSIDDTGATLSSVDTNLSCVVPSGFVPTGSTTTIAINTLESIASLNQPDIGTIRLRSVDGISNNANSIPYEIKILDSSIVDSLGIFVGGKRISLTFFYDPNDPTTQLYEGENSYKIYRYNPTFQKWILHGGHVNTSANTVNFEVNREGIYTIFRNRDTKAPSVDVNVQDQEFTVGGYVSGDGIISLLLSDANGIDVIDDTIRLSMNGNAVAPEDFVISINLENINRVPIKYQLALNKGNHELKVDCKDLNGNFTTRIVQFVVNDEFDMVKIGNYPNPVLGRAQDPKNDGRTRFTYVLTDTADEVYLKVYTISGRLVKTFRNLPVGVGYHEFPRTLHAWDCKDDEGYPLANGVYFYRIVARQGNKKIEKTMKMAILK